MTTQIVSVDATTSKLQVGAVDAFQFQANGVMSGFTSVNSGYLYGNRVINGAQEIDQVNNGAAVTAVTNPTYATDMFAVYSTQASKLSLQQVADAPAGLKNSLKITVASQYAPIATDNFGLYGAIEGKDVIDFQLGAAGAATFTLSHWIKGSVAGTYCVALRNAALSRNYVGTITVGTSWAPVKLTIVGDVTGTWATDNTIGLSFWWDLGSGSNYNGAANAWQAGVVLRTSGSVTFVNQTAGSTLNITGVDCRLGSSAPAVFERRANELQLAQRYFKKGLAGNMAGYSGLSGTSFSYATGFPIMRATPTVINVVQGGTAGPVGGTSFIPSDSSNLNVSCASTGAGGYITSATCDLAARLF